MDDAELTPVGSGRALGARPFSCRCGSDEPVDALFFDFHGTISTNLFWQSSDITLFRDASVYLFNGDSPLARDWMAGILSTVDICEILQNKFDIPASVFCSAIFCDISKWKIQQEISYCIRQLKKSVDRVFMVSDNTDVFANWFSRSPYRGLFDDVWVSSEYGMLKNDDNGIAYRKLATAHNVDLTRSILFDDSCHSTSTFKQLGGDAVQVADPVDTARLCQDLRCALGTSH